LEEAVVPSDAREQIFQNSATVVTKHALETLHAHLEKTAKANLPLKLSKEADGDFSVAYTASFVDGGNRTIPTLDDLLKYSNRGQRRIRKLDIKTAPAHRGNTVNITIGDNFPVTHIYISGDEAHASAARTYCEDYLAEIRSPFAWLYSASGR
jgi:hypothetical protein